MVLTFAFVNKKTTGSSEVNSVVDPQALQVLTHLPTLWEFRINVFKVNLSRRDNRRNWFKKIKQHLYIYTDRHNFS